MAITSFDAAAFRRCFPACGDDPVYLDSAATALKPQVMIEATRHYYQDGGATVHRSQHHAARRLTQRYEQARAQVSELLHAGDEASVIWTKGATEAINLVAQSFLRPVLQAGDEILVSEAEHHANLIPWLMVAQQCQATVVKLPLNERGVPDINKLPALLTPKTRLLALGQMSNVTGACPDLRAALNIAHANGTPVMVDGAQGIVHQPPDVARLDIDFYAFSAHKLFGPTGLGVLYAHPRWFSAMSPWQGGGKMLTQASFSGFTPQPIPHMFEAGTPNIAGVVGFSAVLEWMKEIDWPAAESHCVALADEAENALRQREGFISYRAANSPVLAFNFAGIHHSDLITLLAEQGIALRAGQHCAQPLMQALGIAGCLRASFAPYNNGEDVKRLLSALDYALTLLSD